MNTEFVSTLNVNKGLEDYENITDIYSVQDHLVPPVGHTQWNQGMEAYTNFTRVLRDRLVKVTMISKDTCPKVFKCLTRKLLNNGRFVILLNIIIKGSPQLGGEERYLSRYVDRLKAGGREELIEFYHRAKKIEYEIQLQKDQTGQHQRLTRRFLQELQKMSEYKTELGNIAKSIKRFFRNRHGLTHPFLIP